MMWKVTCSVKDCGDDTYDAPTQDAALRLAVEDYVHRPIPHSDTWYFSIVPEAE